MPRSELLKKDLFGEIHLVESGEDRLIMRNIRPAGLPFRLLARRLMRREARALAALEGVEGVPRLCSLEHDRLIRTYLAGSPMHRSRPADPDYYSAASRLLRRLHRAGVVHNDLAKEPNLLVTPDGKPVFVDFQLAWYSNRRGRLFRSLAYDDLRHLLKHKRNYCEAFLTRREQAILARPSVPSRLWRQIVKPPYLFVTRRLLGWADREGASDRGTGS